MRITNQTMVTRSLDRLQTRLEAYERGQSELATGKRILQPSDDPGGARRAMTIRAGMRAREQELRNVNDAHGWLNQADSQLQTALERVRRARDLTVDGATVNDPAAQRTIATEIREIADELVGVANTQHQGRPLFGGYHDGVAIEQDLTADPPALAFNPDDDADRILRRVSDTEQVRINVTAAEWLGHDQAAADAGTPSDLVTQLRQLADDIEAGDQEAASVGLATIDAGADRIATNLANIGAATNRVDSAQRRADDALLTMRTELSNVEDVDVAAGLMEMQVQEIGYQTTLQALGRALPPSLVSFLR